VTVGLWHNPSHISNDLLEAGATFAENEEFICYNDGEDGDTAISSLSESEIDDDDNDIRDVSANLVEDAADF
jgi:hypothetical protein